MGQIKAIGDQEEKIFNTPDSPGGSDLGESPSYPGLDRISKQQCNTHDRCQNLDTDDQQLQPQEIGSCLTQQAANVAVPGSSCQWHEQFVE